MSITLENDVFSGKHGEVGFEIATLAGCCGVSEIHDVHFDVKRDHNVRDLYREFNNALRNKYNDNYEWRVAKLLMSDVKDGPIYKFCMAMGWYYSPPHTNPKTGRQIYVFEINRIAKQKNGNPGYHGGGRRWW